MQVYDRNRIRAMARRANADITDAIVGGIKIARHNFRGGNFASEVIGGASCNYQYGALHEAGGSGNGVYMSVASGDKSAMLVVPFYGPLVGLRTNDWIGRYDVMVDGVVYTIDNSYQYIYNGVGWGLNGDIEKVWIVERNLDPRKRHYLTFLLPPPASSTRSLVIFGLVVAEGFNVPESTTCIAKASITLTAAMATIANESGSKMHRILDHITYTNTHTSAVVVQIDDGSKVIWEETLAAAGTSGASKIYEHNAGYQSILRQKASVDAVVNAVSYWRP